MGRLAQWQIWLATALLSVIAALSLWYGVTRHGQAGLAVPSEAIAKSRAEEPTRKRAKPVPGAPIDAGTALQYVKAVQENRCPVVIDLVWWIQERLRTVRLTEGADGLATEKDRLCARLTDRSLGGGRLTAEGVEDQYIFRPGAVIEVEGRDEGRDDLDKPVDYRVWFRVTFGSVNAAVHDETGRAIRAMTVGVNISADGHVLKAGVTGNTEIEWTTIDYDWTDL